MTDFANIFIVLSIEDVIFDDNTLFVFCSWNIASNVHYLMKFVRQMVILTVRV